MGTRIPRKKLLQFARDITSADCEQFGSEAAGLSVPTTDVETIQAGAAWLTNWKDALNATDKSPYVEDWNAVCKVFGYFLCYLLQEGIPEWNTDTEYFINSIVKKTGTLELYASLVDNNLSHALPNQADNSYWTYLGTLGAVATGSVKGLMSAADKTKLDGLSSAVMAKAYVNIDGSNGNVRQGYNIASVTRTSTGNYTINFTTPFADTSYIAVMSATFHSAAGAVVPCIVTQNVGSITVHVRDIASNTDFDPTVLCVALFGNQ